MWYAASACKQCRAEADRERHGAQHAQIFPISRNGKVVHGNIAIFHVRLYRLHTPNNLKLIAGK